VAVQASRLTRTLVGKVPASAQAFFPFTGFREVLDQSETCCPAVANVDCVLARVPQRRGAPAPYIDRVSKQRALQLPHHNIITG
jgi:hypothetical protein